jgi:hypothetical protein
MSFHFHYSYRTKQAVYGNNFMREIKENTDGEKCRLNADTNNRAGETLKK